MADQAGLMNRILTKSARTGVIGIGYVGLPLVVAMAKAGFRTYGIDIDPKKVEAINQGKSFIEDISDDEIRPLVQSGHLSATTDPSVLEELDTISICVPTPLRKTKDPDISFIDRAVDMISKYMGRKKLIVLESTTYPGTTEEIVLPKLQCGNLQAGKDFHLAFSPERIDPGNKTYTLTNTPKIVGGITAECTEMAACLYGQFVENIVKVTSPKTAEMVKLVENTFRTVNIGLVNELALMCDKMGIDVWEVVDAAGTKPFGFMPFYPGPGLGGHCLPVDPQYLSWKAKTLKFYAKFIELAGEINGLMPKYVFSKIVDGLNAQKKCVNGSNIFILGVSYKGDVGDIRESPALDIIELLTQSGGIISYHDPHVPRIKMENFDLASCSLSEDSLHEADCVVLITDHSAFDIETLVRWSRLFVDTRNVTKGIRNGREKIIKI